MAYAVAKALHIIGFISWFAGLFYLPRLFIYHVEDADKDEGARELLQKQLELMASRLWKIITVPAMVVTLAAGTTMVVLREGSLPMWLHIKFGFLLLLLVYHHYCGRIRRQQADGTSTWTSKQLRIFNEGATMLMVAIVFLAVLKSGLDALWGSLGFVAFGTLLMVGIRVYAKLRKDG
jgi:putative membrane protein